MRSPWHETDWILFCMHGKPYSFTVAPIIDSKTSLFSLLMNVVSELGPYHGGRFENLRVVSPVLTTSLTFSLPVVPAAPVRYSGPDSFAQGLNRSCGLRICRVPEHQSY